MPQSIVSFLLSAGLLAAAPAIVHAVGTASWNDWQVIWEEHTDLATSYTPSTNLWSLRVQHDFSGNTPAEQTLFWIKSAARRTVPESRPASVAFLGEPGDSYYWLPAGTPSFEVVELGFNASGVPANFFTGSFGGTINIVLFDFSGPGDLFLYGVRPGGIVDLYFDTRPSAGPYGQVPIPVGGHAHFNWALKEKGIYVLHLRGKGTRADGGGEIASEPVPHFFLVEPTPADWWRVDQFKEAVNAPENSLLGDISGDGHANLLAYAFGFNPAESTLPFLPLAEIVERNGQSHLSLVVRRPEGTPGRDDRSDLAYRVQVSSDLVLWTELAATSEAMPPAADGTPRIRVVDTAPLSQTDRRFMRMVVEKTQP